MKGRYSLCSQILCGALRTCLLHVLQLLRLLQLLHGSSKLCYPLTGVTIVDNACNGEVADKYSH